MPKPHYLFLIAAALAFLAMVADLMGKPHAVALLALAVCVFALGVADVV
jgi:hypothetical protein